MLCQEYLHLMIDRLVFCRLVNKEETPGLLDLFYSRGYHINQFLHLQSLPLHGIDDRNIAEMLDGLAHLVSLSITHCAVSRESDNTLHLINRIGHLPKLRHCKLDSGRVCRGYFDSRTAVSTTLERLNVQGAVASLTFGDLAALLSYTPRLRLLSLNMVPAGEKEHERFPIMNVSITNFKLMYRGGTQALSKLLQSMPHLRQLTVDLQNNKLNGHEWQSLIRGHALQLKILHFMMSVGLLRKQLANQEIDALLDTFRTPFWLHERHWYFRCDVEHRCLYTVPYAFDFYTTSLINPTFTWNGAGNARQSKWTCLDDQNYWLYDRVRRLDCNIHAKDSSYLYPAVVPKIRKLTIGMPSCDTIWRLLPTFDHLTTLYIGLHEEVSESRLQALFDQSPRLYTLIIDFYVSLSKLMTIFQLRSPSIRRIRLGPEPGRPWFYLDDAHCTAFAHTPLAQQCEALEIRLISPNGILKLVDPMSKLRAMTVHVRNDERAQPCRTQTELIEWAREHLSARCLISSGSSWGKCFRYKALVPLKQK